MRERTTTVNIDEKGRATIPKPMRKALGINGEKHSAEITVRIEENADG